MEKSTSIGNTFLPTVSVVMSIYNVEEYLEEAIRSIIEQDIGFENNIQLILVNDGSTDNSGGICEKYATQYPDNILYLEKENGGQSSARNMGLSHVRGKYINFMDSDDTMSKNAFRQVVSFFDDHYYEMDMACVPLYYFEAENGIHGKYVNLGKKNKIIDLTKNPSDFILSSASAFYKAEALNDLRFDEQLCTAEDAKFNLAVIKNTFRIGYVCENGVCYNYRKRLAGGSNVDRLTSGESYNALMAPVKMFEDMIPVNRELAPYEKELITYELRSRLRVIKQNGLSENEYNTVISAYSKWISRLDTDFIVRTKWLESIDKKMLFLQLSGRSFSDLTRNGHLPLTDRVVSVTAFYYLKGKVHFLCRFNNFGEDDFEIAITDEKGELTIFADNSIDVSGPYDSVYGEFHMDKTHIRDFVMPMEAGTYRVCYVDLKTGVKSMVHRLNTSHSNPVCSNIKNVGPIYEGFCFNIYDGKITITDDANVLLSKNNAIKQATGREFPARLFNSEKKFILINDRPEKAGDNGEALFNYIMENEDEKIRQNTFFIINTDCEDYKNMKHKDHIINFRSAEHLDMFINAKVIYSSHLARNFYYPFKPEDYRYYADLLSYKFVWLQHGVIKDDLQKDANKYNGYINAMITSTKWETNELRSPQYLYNENDVIPSGLARFDELYDHRRNLITIMPTWRKELVGAILPNGHHEASPLFESSEFYKNYINILTDPEIISTLRANDYEIDFVLHSGFTVYEELFESINCDVIHLRHMEEFSYKQAFSESSLCVTDYSSAVFDFAFLGKPIIYFQFDEDSFFDKHYQKSDWEYRKDGFGPVLNTVEDFKKTLSKYIQEGCAMEPAYLERVNSSFIHRDHNQCKRIMDATREWCLEENIIPDRCEIATAEEYRKQLTDVVNQLKKVQDKYDTVNYYLEETRKSFSYKLGYSLTTAPRKIRSLIKRDK